MRNLVVVLLVAIMASASAPNPFQASSIENLQRATAKAVGGDVRTSEVTITNVKRKSLSVTWYAKIKDVCYECDADDMLRDTHVVKIDCSLVPAEEEKKKK